MRLSRIATLVGKDLYLGSKSVIFAFAIVIPVVLSLLISLMFGTIFAGKPRLGVVDAGRSQLVDGLTGLEYLVVRPYATADELTRDVDRGAVDMGIVLSPGLDAALRSGAPAEMDVYLWGESLLKHRAVLAVSLSRQLVEVAGREIPVETVTTLVGDQASVPWEIRLFPLVVIMTIILGGTMVPATSIVEEKQHRTLTALTITPLSLGELLAAKGIAGALISLGMGLVILTMNRGFGAHPGLMVLVMALGAILASTLGVLLGVWVKDINTLFTTLKSLGILLYAPALVYLFPQIPEWVGRVFPTYYVIGPIVDMSLYGAGWPEIAADVTVLGALCVAAMLGAGYLARRREGNPVA